MHTKTNPTAGITKLKIAPLESEIQHLYQVHKYNYAILNWYLKAANYYLCLQISQKAYLMHIVQYF